MPEPNWAELLEQLEWADSGSSPDTTAALKAAVIALLRDKVRVDNHALPGESYGEFVRRIFDLNGVNEPVAGGPYRFKHGL